MTIKENILKHMNQKNLTLTNLSQKAGIGMATLQNIVYDRSKNPTIQVMIALANALNCSLYDLIETPMEKNIFVTHWNQTLYGSCVQCILNHLSNAGKDLSYGDLHFLVKQAYTFSVESECDTADDRFCKWIVRKKLEA
jgi:DNA-binding Xre family transcriptional regulator